MAIWQWALLLLALVWGLQAFGVWRQMRHYSDVFRGITEKYRDGFVGAGNFRGRFKRGTIAMVVVTPDLVVRRLLVMSGRTVFTKFKRREAFEGMPLETLRQDPAMVEPEDPGVAEAITRAIEQIDRARADPDRKDGLKGIEAPGA